LYEQIKAVYRKRPMTRFWTQVLAKKERRRKQFEESCKGSLAWVDASFQDLEYQAPETWRQEKRRELLQEPL
jgi:hypothetical protein